MVTSRDVNAERIRNIKTDNSSLERMEKAEIFGNDLNGSNYIQEEIKSRL